jgi:hypothetical protein
VRDVKEDIQAPSGEFGARLASRYQELMALRDEARTRYRVGTSNGLGVPPARLLWPRVSFDRTRSALTVERPPSVYANVGAVIDAAAGAVTILEIGPGRGVLCSTLRHRFGPHIGRYYGIEVDQSVVGSYARIDEPSDAAAPIDLVIAGEVAEHMTADAFLALLESLHGCRSASSALVVSVPNPLAPGGIARDVTHVQHYPWYDLYALLRLEYDIVDVVRTYYVWNVGRLLRLPMRMILCSFLELDWAEGILCTARRPREP